MCAALLQAKFRENVLPLAVYSSVSSAVRRDNTQKPGLLPTNLEHADTL